MKLFLYSLSLSPEQAAALTDLVGKDPKHTQFAIIENAADIVPNAIDWVGGFRDMLLRYGYQLERVDLRKWINRPDALRDKLASKDVIWLGGGHTYYLRWILRESGADTMIKNLVSQGIVYAGWSAGAVVAGPTTQYFDGMGDNLQDSPEIILDGLNLTNLVVVPHLDNKEFADDAKTTNRKLVQAGYHTLLLGDSQALVIDGNRQKII
ncbi:MAG: Type 1 glutamine amidotransferase-like domain-containing protein [Bacteroidota bacterium]